MTCWQLVCRTGDLLRGKFRVGQVWDPQFETHRDRFVLARVPETPYLRVLLHLPPGKTNRPSEQGPTKTAIVDPEPESLSAGAALARMLEGDPTESGADPSTVPLFRDPATGVEIRYAYVDALLRAALHAVGHSDVANGQHSLRRGGCSAAGDVGGR